MTSVYNKLAVIMVSLAVALLSTLTTLKPGLHPHFKALVQNEFTLTGIEAMDMLRKGQVELQNSPVFSGKVHQQSFSLNYITQTCVVA